MKTFRLAFFCFATFAVAIHAQTLAQTGAAPPATQPGIVDTGANFNRWQWQTFESLPHGKVLAHTHSYIELASGLNMLNANGAWVPANAGIEAFPGGAIVRHCQHNLIFSTDLNSAGAIQMQTPDGKVIASTPLGLMYTDPTTGQSVQIAGLVDSEGELIANDEVLYPDAFQGVGGVTGVSASVLYRNRLDGMEQNIILKTQLPSPNAFSMNPDTTYLEVFTQIVDPPAANVATLDSDASGDDADQAVSWGATSLGRGRAFIMGGLDTPVPVIKRYVKVAGSYFLLEKVRFRDIQQSLSTLPLQSSNAKALRGMASTHFQFPKGPRAKSAARPLRLALGQKPGPGYVLDYTTLNSSYTNYNFQGDVTYYLS